MIILRCQKLTGLNLDKTKALWGMSKNGRKIITYIPYKIAIRMTIRQGGTLTYDGIPIYSAETEPN